MALGVYLGQTFTYSRGREVLSKACDHGIVTVTVSCSQSTHHISHMRLSTRQPALLLCEGHGCPPPERAQNESEVYFLGR